MKPRDIFGLAVRLLGLFFLYLSLKAVAQMLDLDLIENPDKTDLINAALPAAFNLVLAAFLIHGKFLINWAYPESAKTAVPPQSQPKQSAPQSVPKLETVAPPAPAGMDVAEAKLAALVEKPKESR